MWYWEKKLQMAAKTTAKDTASRDSTNNNWRVFNSMKMHNASTEGKMCTDITKMLFEHIFLSLFLSVLSFLSISFPNEDFS